MKFLYSNADSLRNKLRELEIVNVREKADIIIITEALPKNSLGRLDENEFQLPGYNTVSNFGEPSCRRGIIIFWRCSLDIELSPLSTSYSEYINMIIQGSHGVKLGILAIYRSPNSSIDNNENLIKLINESTNDNLQRIIVGDFNLRGINWDMLVTESSAIDSFESQFLEAVLDCYLEQKVCENTRFRQGQDPSLLDLIFVNQDDLIEDINHLEPLGSSDHVVLGINVNMSGKSKVAHKAKLDFKRGDYDGMRTSLGKVNWDDELRDKTVEEMWQTISGKLKEFTTKFIPLTKVKVKVYPRWISQESRKAIKEKKRPGTSSDM